MGVTILIDDVPDDVYSTLRSRAEEAGVSLESYVRDLLVRAASRPEPRSRSTDR